ncbi:hypothetical protein DSL72_006353 [Monilinia vaccinii-corymbosi]|uniref:Uncharacterized protein n=1 Tax=Monilinia vaccinii-corymbosi TaxID=61207 RepID=A0A8A3PNH5_9HELO|nr:hypothetical protein DSL72_006353 [Monilinia vaccinii-corymbosi]
MKNKARIGIKNGQTPLHQQIIDKTDSDLNLDDASKQYLDVPDILGWTPLHYAVIYSPTAVAALAVMGLSKDLQKEATKSIISELLKANPTPISGRDGLFPLHWAVKTGKFEAAEQLLKKELHKDTIDKQDYWKMTPLHFAATGGYLKILQLLLDKRNTTQILNAQDRLLLTPLHVAIETVVSLKRADIVAELLKKGASFKIKDKNHKTALELAAEIERKLCCDKEQSNLKSSVAADNCSETKVSPNDNEARSQQHDITISAGSKGVVETEQKTSGKAEIKLSIQYLLGKENLSVDGGSLLLWATKNNFMTSFEVLMESAKITNKQILVLRAHFSILLRIKGYQSAIEKLLKNKIDINIEDENGLTALSWAVESGQLNTVKVLTKQGPPAAENIPMSIAVMNGKYDIVEFFLGPEGRAHPDDIDGDGYSMLCLAVVYDQKDIVKLLIDHNANIEKPSGSCKQTPLSLAAEKGNLEIIQLLLDHKASLEAKDTDGWTPLICALESKQPKAVKLLLGKGIMKASTENRYLKQLNQAMIWACRTGEEELVKLLLDHGTNANVQDDASESTPLMEAIKGGFLGIVEQLVAKGVLDSAQNGSNSTALLTAAEGGHKDIVALLLENGVGVNARNKENDTPLLLATGADFDLANDKKKTPLTIAVRTENEKLVELLLEAGAKVNTKDYKQKAPLFRAVYSENLTLVRLLLEANADVNTDDEEGMTPLLQAVYDENLTIVRLLLSAGAKANVEIAGRRSPLFQAVCNGNLAIVELLLKKDVNINTKGHSRTPLFQAVFNEKSEFVHMLLEWGADTESHPTYCRTPLQEAARSGTEEILDD